jgi:hypothetical protein
MASTAWTVTRAELVEQLAKTRAVAARAATEAARLHAEADERRRRDVERQRRSRNQRRATAKERALIVAELRTRGNREALELQEAFRRTPPDPNADLHRLTLIAALKEKP